MNDSLMTPSNKRPGVILEESLSQDLKYTETVIEHEGRCQGRRCSLWHSSETQPVSDLELLSIMLRFGATALPIEGVGGVQTQVRHQRKGYMQLLMSHAIERARRRVCAAFLYGTPSIYSKWGFTTCATSSWFKMQAADFRNLQELPMVRRGSATDLPAIVKVYNRDHGSRPWTVQRDSSWNHLIKPEVWQPGSDVFVYEERSDVAAYAIAKGHSPRCGHRQLVVEELGAVDPDSAMIMLQFLARVCWEGKREQFTVFEPIDSSAGIAARRFGCEVVTRYFTDSNTMGVILNRDSLVTGLKNELHRRVWLAGLNEQISYKAIALLRSGQLVPDQGELLRLMVGYEATSHTETNDHATLLRAWFPGGGSPVLPIPYSHSLDHY